MRRLIITFIFFLFGATLFAEGIVYINETNNDKAFDLSGNVFYLIDSSNQYSFEQVLSSEFDSKFTQSDKPTFVYYLNAPSQWYKIKIQNNTNQIQQVVLSINNPIITDITFFNTFDSLYYHTGFFHPFMQRQIVFQNYLFKIKIKSGQRGTICLKVNMQLLPEYLPISLMPEKVVVNKLRINAFAEGLFYCILLFFLLMIIILWRSEKLRSYWFLFGIVVVLGLISLWRDGHLFHYLWPNYPMVNYMVGRLLYPILVFFILLFEFNYLKIRKVNKHLTQLVKFGLLLSVIFAVLQLFVSSNNLFFYGYRFLLIVLFIAIIWGIYVNRKNKIPFFNQYSLALVLIVVNLVIPAFFLVESFGIGFYDLQISTIATTLFFFIMIFIFISKFQNSRLEVIDLNKNLEQLVEKRTYQLNSQKEELTSQHEELIQQKDTLQTQREELRAQKELLEVKNYELGKLSLVASKTDNLIYIFLPNGQLDWFNNSFSLQLGMTLEEYHRDEPLNIVGISSNKNIRHVLNTCLQEKSVVSYESKMVNENNHEMWYHTTLTPILDERENINYLIAIDTDITKLKQYEEELNRQRKDAELQRNLAITSKEELEVRQIEVTDSIRYAKRIQTGIMPKVKQIQRDFHDSFVLFLPKDIVSGDFYWYHRIEDKYFIAAVDCTGHGVPGAFMSIIGTYLLNSIIIYNGVTDAAEILKQLNRKIKIALKADSRSQTSDGMDISIAIVDKNEKTVEFASALRPIYLFNNGNFIEIKGDKIPITSSISGTSITSFTNHNYPFNEGDMFYLFSDGIIDQFGGKTGKKFLTKRFKQLLFEINPLVMREQKDIIKKAFDDWRGENEQVDDILVMGVRYKD